MYSGRCLSSGTGGSSLAHCAERIVPLSPLSSGGTATASPTATTPPSRECSSRRWKRCRYAQSTSCARTSSQPTATSSADVLRRPAWRSSAALSVPAGKK